MKLEDIKKVVVVGSGNMGRQIALNTARYGFTVVQNDISADALKAAQDWAANYLEGRIKKGKMTQEEVDAAKGRLTYEADLEAAVADADVVIEAALENLEVKKALFAQLDQLCPDRTILATNSSSIGSSKIAVATNRADRVCNMHYFNPAMVMQLVEVVRNPDTSEDTIQLIMDLCRATGKTPILLQKEIHSFVVSRLMDGCFKEAFYLVDQGIATIEEIDIAAEKGLGYPMGPFRLLDQIGIDVSYNVRKMHYDETGDEKDKPSHLLEEKVLAGKLGRKTGEGFYKYEKK